MTELFRRLLAIVIARGLTPGKVGRYQFIAAWDGGARWDNSQGAIPTVQQIGNANVALADSFLKQQRRDGEITTVIIAVAKAAGLTKAQVQAAYDTLVN